MRNKRTQTPVIIVIAAFILLVLLFASRGYNEPASNAFTTSGLAATNTPAPVVTGSDLHFRNSKLLMQHFEKHGRDMGFSSAEEYEKAAAKAAADPNALHKTESDDGDDVYYIEATNEFVVVSTDGFIRTYFLPDSGIRYFNKQ